MPAMSTDPMEQINARLQNIEATLALILHALLEDEDDLPQEDLEGNAIPTRIGSQTL
jgi:hypothetical protein